MGGRLSATRSRRRHLEQRGRHDSALMLAMVVLGACSQAAVVFRSAFFFDDLTYFQVAREMGLGRDLLARSANGHLIPGFHLANFLYWRWFGMAWWPAAVYLVALWAIACGLVLAVGRELSSSRRAATLATIVFAVSPIPVASTTWWAAGISVITTLVASLVALLAFLRWDRSRWSPWLLVLALSYAVALAFWEKALLLSVEAVVLSVVLLDHDVGLRERCRRLARRTPAWLSFAGPAVVDLWFYLRGTYLHDSGEPASLPDVLHFSWTAFSQALVPGLAGLKPPDQEIHGSSLPLVVVAWLVVGGVCVHLSRTRSGTAPGWVFLLLTCGLNLAVIGRGRAGVFGTDAGLDLRYHLDMLLLSAIAIAWVVGRPRRPGAATTPPSRLAVAVVAYVVVCSFTAHTVLTHLGGPGFARSDWTVQTRSVMDNFSNDYQRFERSDPDLPILDTMMPFPPVFSPYPYDRASRSLVLYEPSASFTRRDETGLMMADDGHLVPSAFEGDEVSATGPACVSPGSAPRVLEVDPTAAEVGDAVAVHLDRAPGATVAIVLRTGGSVTLYLTDPQGLSLDTADPSLMLQLPTDRVGADGVRRVVHFDDLAVYGVTGTGCITSARSGRVQPISEAAP